MAPGQAGDAMRRVMLMLLLLAASAAARADWQEASSAHFIVYSNDTPEHVRQLGEKLERYDRALRVLRNVPEHPVIPSARVQVYVLNGLSDLHELLGKGSDKFAGVYLARAEGPVAFVPRRLDIEFMSPLTVLLHEYAHHFMYSSWPGVVFPRWYVEGFAEFHATTQFRSDGSVVAGAIPEFRYYGVGWGNQLPLRQLLLPNPGKLDDLQMTALYGRSWLLTHYLTLGKPARLQQLADYVKALNEGKPPAEASRAFGSLADGDLDGYLKNRTLPARVLDAGSMQVGTVAVRALTPAEADMMPARLRSQLGVDKKSAPEVVALARRLAEPHPGDAATLAELMEAEFDAGNYAAARAAAEQVLAQDPHSVRAMDYAGRARMAAAQKSGGFDPAEWRAIRGLFLAANREEPANPEPLMLFYESYGAAMQAPSAGARNGLISAYGLAPYDLNLRMTAARLFLEDDKALLARQAIAPVAYGIHDESGGDVAVKMLDALDQADTAAALQVLVNAEREAMQKAKDKKQGAGD
jgi:tetratricopeptide (TPR) repeat protein